jgi:hypothetical protein
VALPVNREEFKAKVLRALGGGVIQINVSDDQLEDMVDNALQYYRDYHYNGSERVYLAHQVTSQDKTNKYLDLDDKYFGVVRIFDLSSALGSSNLFSLTFQFAQSDFLSSALTGSMIPYWMAMTHIELIQQILIGRQPIRFNEHKNRLHVDMDWDRVNTGEYIVVECFEELDPDEWTEIWGDRWLLKYTTAITKKMWGENLGKYGGLKGPDGTTFNFERILDEANEEIEKLEEEMIGSYSMPNLDFWG